MSEIVDKLRAYNSPALAHEAADRIETLEAALQKIAKREYREPWDVIDIARAALTEGPSRVETVATGEHLPSPPSDAGRGR